MKAILFLTLITSFSSYAQIFREVWIDDIQVCYIENKLYNPVFNYTGITVRSDHDEGRNVFNETLSEDLSPYLKGDSLFLLCYTYAPSARKGKTLYLHIITESKLMTFQGYYYKNYVRFIINKDFLLSTVKILNKKKYAENPIRFNVSYEKNPLSTTFTDYKYEIVTNELEEDTWSLFCRKLNW